MSALTLIKSFTRLSVVGLPKNVNRTISTNLPVFFRATPCLMAEPLKKKKKMDPQVLKQREDRKKKKIEKQIRRLEKNASQLKPIEECEVSLTLLDEKRSRLRKLPALSQQILEDRALLQKQWASYKKEQHLMDIQMLDRIGYAQQKALDELRLESEELYQEAIAPDFTLLPHRSSGPLETPPIKNYESPDGDYTDVSKVWE